MIRGPTIADIRREAQARIFDILSALGVSVPARAGAYISICNPVVKDRNPSFTIWVRGVACGGWRDERNCGPGGDRGDVIDLVSYLSGWWQLPKKGRHEALLWLTNYLGLATIDPAEMARARKVAQRHKLEALKRDEEQLADNRARAAKLFFSAAEVGGTIAEVYLKGRGIDLARLPRGPRGGERRVPIRFLASTRHTESGELLPAMIACCTDTSTRAVQAMHRTFLARDGGGKALVRPVKKVWPSFAGLVIPLWRGESGLNVREANANGLRETLVLTEGIEDGLSAVIAAPKFRTWAFIALGNLGNLELPDCIDSVLIHRQSEWQNTIAVNAFERGVKALCAQGRPVEVIKAVHGKDLNDTLKGGDPCTTPSPPQRQSANRSS